jgi:hypothetical protein
MLILETIVLINDAARSQIYKIAVITENEPPFRGVGGQNSKEQGGRGQTTEKKGLRGQEDKLKRTTAAVEQELKRALESWRQKYSGYMDENQI